MGRLDGKVTLISGTGRGMGRTAALEFAREGARVVGCDLDVGGLGHFLELAPGHAALEQQAHQRPEREATGC